MTTILVVDDEPDLEVLVTQKFRRQIREGTFAFLFARDGVEALETVAAHPEIDLVLSDINMPRMDGLTLLARLQESATPLATVIVSAYGDMSNIRTAMNSGAFDFLTKPIDFADVEATISRPILQRNWPPMRAVLIWRRVVGISPPCSRMSRISPDWSKRSSPPPCRSCSMATSQE
jgi:YesN/AraC family two-component response regulator